MRAILWAAAFAGALSGAVAGAQTLSPATRAPAKQVSPKQAPATRAPAKQATATRAPAKPATKTHVVAKHKAAGVPATHHVPVVSPHHGAAPRRPVTHASGTHRSVAKEGVVVEPPAPAAPVAVAKKPAPPPVPANLGTVTGMPLPRFASLKSDDVNMRVGPAERYPVIWNYRRRELPVKIEREFDIWRLVEDMDGIKGWVQLGTITGRRTFVTTGTEDRTVRSDASETADAVAVLKLGVVGRIKSCEAGRAWCQIEVQGYRGWLRRSDFWGVDADEAVTP